MINSTITKNMTLDELVHCANSDPRYYEGLALKVLEGYTPTPNPEELKTLLEEAFNDGLEEGQKES
tara:strand:- start:506 stop:703 length:198 start_codon:yes stop_codon:yes gene_type:complete